MAFLKQLLTGFTKIRLLQHGVKKTATGEVHLQFTVDLLKHCPITGCSTHLFQKEQLSEQQLVMECAEDRVIAEIMYCDFLGRSGDEVFNQLPKWQAMSGNIIKMPVVIRVSVGSKYGAQHSQDWSSLTAHIPGLKVVFPGHTI